MKNANANWMKEINLNNVRLVMKRIETATKPQLATLTGLSVVTVNSLVKELHGLGELFEDEAAPSSGGRPALNYRYNYDYAMALVLYIQERQGQELAVAAVVNLADDAKYQEELVLPVFELASFYAMIDGILEQYPAIQVIGIGIPGQVVLGEITVSSHVELRGVRMAEELQTRFGLPVMIENDVNAAVVGYCTRDAEFGENMCVTGIYFPGRYPPGMGIYVDGRLIKGKHGMAGEIKFLPLELDWKVMGMAAEQEFIEAVCKILQIVNAVLAPNQIILYQNRVAAEAWSRAWDDYRLTHPMAIQPEIRVLDSFQADFEAGMRWLTLQELMPVIAEPNR